MTAGEIAHAAGVRPSVIRRYLQNDDGYSHSLYQAGAVAPVFSVRILLRKGLTPHCGIIINIKIREGMDIQKILKRIRESPQNIRFPELAAVCREFFGAPRQRGTSHCVFRTPWPGDPRVNIQDKNGMGKPYQVKQVLAAIKKLQEGAQ